MNILGINGLGVTPSACIIVDGKLLAMAEEERFTRLKGSYGMMPAKASRFCLDFATLSLEDIDYVAFGWDAKRYDYYMPLFVAYNYLKGITKIKASSNFYRAAEQLIKYRSGHVKYMIREMFRNSGVKGKIPEIEFIPHHLSHAASTFYTSGFDEAHILVIDGSGEDRATTIMKGKGTDISVVKSFKIPDSLGWFYQSITEYLGFLPDRHEGKVMALACYGEYDEAIEKKMKKMITYSKNGCYKYNAEYGVSGTHEQGRVFSEEMVKLFGPPRYKEDAITQAHKNIAYSGQKILEDITRNMVYNISSGSDFNGNICIAGGVGLNCKMNGVIASMECVKDVFVPPVTSDAGSALGAALYLSKMKGFDPRNKMTHAYWGPHFEPKTIKNELIRHGVQFKEEPQIESTIAKYLSEDKVIGWFQGRMEVGPRALGARSILASPLKENMKDHINLNIKGRENWRPFAASILYEEKENFVLGPKDSPFMALAFKVKPDLKGKIQSAIHIDETTRPQFVQREINPKYWNLINEFGKITGVYALLNTSLNTDEEPIVCTPEQALRTFYASGMDYLVIENFIICK